MKQTQVFILNSFPEGGAGGGPLELREYDDNRLFGCLFWQGHTKLGEFAKQVLALEQELKVLGFNEVYIELDSHEPFFTISGRK